jgi:hypothetical protein
MLKFYGMDGLLNLTMRRSSSCFLLNTVTTFRNYSKGRSRNCQLPNNDYHRELRISLAGTEFILS